MAHYQSIPAATHQANAEQPEEETVTIHTSNGMVWRITGAVLLLFTGLAGFATTTQTSRSENSLLAGTSAATALLRSTTTTTVGPDVYDPYPGVFGRDDDGSKKVDDDTSPDDDPVITQLGPAADTVDRCCAPATGTWSGPQNTNDEFWDLNHPSEQCYSSCDPSSLQALVSRCYCWSKSYYDGNDWVNCKPEGGNWQLYGLDGLDSSPTDHWVSTDQEKFCGTPCQDFDDSVPTCPVPVPGTTNTVAGAAATAVAVVAAAEEKERAAVAVTTSTRAGRGRSANTTSTVPIEV